MADVDISATYQALIRRGWVGPERQYALDVLDARGTLEPGTRVLDLATGCHRTVERRDGTNGTWFFVDETD